MSNQNPKLENSNIIDCIPQVGECPLKCLECYYNGGRFYRTLDIPLIPIVEESKGKIVRINSGHDSNLEYEKVMRATKKFKDKFFNTSIPNLRFGNPTVLTLNGRDTDLTFYHRKDVEGKLSDLMFVRFRVNTWNTPLCYQAIMEWAKHCPVVLTDMRYYDKNNIKEQKYYQYGKHILNEYWKLNSEGYNQIFNLLAFQNVYWCGNPFTLSTFCNECRLCEHLYIMAKRRIENAVFH